nr:hypothetical protein [Tanacetum cinerariifolium]
MLGVKAIDRVSPIKSKSKVTGKSRWVSMSERVLSPQSVTQYNLITGKVRKESEKAAVMKENSVVSKSKVAAVVSEKSTDVKETVVKSIEKSTVVKERDVTSKVGKSNVSAVVSEKSVVDEKDNPKVSKVSDESNKAAVVAPVIEKVSVATESDKETEPVVVADVKAPVVAAVESVVEKDNPKVTSKVSDESVKASVIKESIKVPVVKKSIKASSVVADKSSSVVADKVDVVVKKSVKAASVVADKPSSVVADKVDVVVKKSVKASSVVADKPSSVVADKVDVVVKKSVKASSVVAEKPSSVVANKVDVVKDNINVVADKVVKENALSVVADKASNINVVAVVDKASDALKNKPTRKGKKLVVGKDKDKPKNIAPDVVKEKFKPNPKQKVISSEILVLWLLKQEENPEFKAKVKKEESDEESVPKKGKKKEKQLTPKEAAHEEYLLSFPSFHSRTTPSSLFSAIKNSRVVILGFLIDLGFSSLHNAIKLREADHEFIRKWAGQFYPLELKKVCVNDIARKLIVAQEIDFFFKVNFLTSFTNTMGKADGLKGQICLDVELELKDRVVGLLDLHDEWNEAEVQESNCFIGFSKTSKKEDLIKKAEEKLTLIYAKRVMLEYIRKASLKCPGDGKFVALHEKYVNLFKYPISFEDDGNGDNVGNDDDDDDDENKDEDGGNVDNDANDGDGNRDEEDVNEGDKDPNGSNSSFGFSKISLKDFGNDRGPTKKDKVVKGNPTEQGTGDLFGDNSATLEAMNQEITLEKLPTQKASLSLKKRGDKIENVFEAHFGKFIVYGVRLNLETLAPGLWLDANVIDCWGTVLNHEESFRAAELKSMHFFLTGCIKKLFAWHLKQYGHIRHTQVDKVKHTIPKLKWNTKENFHDCGIFTMLHMETFDDRPALNLDCGLPVESQLHRDMLMRLRFKFATKILLHEINVHTGKMLELTKEFDKTDLVEKMAIIVDAFKGGT